MKSKYLFILVLLLVFAACKTKQKQDDLKVTVVPQDTVKVAETPPPPPPPVEKIDVGVNLDDKYFLVVDSYTVKEFAESWNRKYQQEGFKSAVIMRNEDGYYRVAVESFKDFDLAKTAMNELRKEEGFENTWIMIISK